MREYRRKYFAALMTSVLNSIRQTQPTGRRASRIALLLLIRFSQCAATPAARERVEEFTRATRYAEVCISKIYSRPGFVSCTHCDCRGRCDIATYYYMHIVIRCGILSTMVLALIAPRDQIRTRIGM